MNFTLSEIVQGESLEALESIYQDAFSQLHIVLEENIALKQRHINDQIELEELKSHVKLLSSKIKNFESTIKDNTITILDLQSQYDNLKFDVRDEYLEKIKKNVIIEELMVEREQLVNAKTKINILEHDILMSLNKLECEKGKNVILTNSISCIEESQHNNYSKQMCETSHNLKCMLTSLEKHKIDSFPHISFNKENICEQINDISSPLQLLCHHIYNLSVDGKIFEKLICILFDCLGYKSNLRGGSGDNGIDFELHQKDSNRTWRGVGQCKLYTYKIGSSAIREFIGAMVNEGCHSGFFVTSSLFTKEAYNTANSWIAHGGHIELWDIRTLMSKMDAHAPYLLQQLQLLKGLSNDCANPNRSTKHGRAGSEKESEKAFRSQNFSRNVLCSIPVFDTSTSNKELNIACLVSTTHSSIESLDSNFQDWSISAPEVSRHDDVARNRQLICFNDTLLAENNISTEHEVFEAQAAAQLLSIEQGDSKDGVCDDGNTNTVHSTTEHKLDEEDTDHITDGLTTTPTTTPCGAPRPNSHNVYAHVNSSPQPGGRIAHHSPSMSVSSSFSSSTHTQAKAGKANKNPIQIPSYVAGSEAMWDKEETAALATLVEKFKDPQSARIGWLQMEAWLKTNTSKGDPLALCIKAGHIDREKLRSKWKNDCKVIAKLNNSNKS